MKTIYQLSESELNQHLQGFKGNGITSQKSRLNFEALVINRGYSFADTYEYINAKNKCDLICPNGHPYPALPNTFNNGIGCRKCSGKCTIEAKKEFEKEVIGRGYSPADTYEYINNSTKCDLICPNGHPYPVSPSNFKQGNGCRKCAGNCPIEAKKDFESLVISRGYSFADTYEYKTNKSTVDLLCPNGHFHMALPSRFKLGNGCRKCAGKCTIEAKKDFESLVISRGYSFADTYEYITTNDKVDLICPNGHPCQIRPSNFKRGEGCSKCASVGRINWTNINRDPELANKDYGFYKILFSHVATEEMFYKNGLTMHTPKARFAKKSDYTMQVLEFVKGKLYQLFALEQATIQTNIQLGIQHTPQGDFPHTGITECYKMECDPEEYKRVLADNLQIQLSKYKPVTK